MSIVPTYLIRSTRPLNHNLNIPYSIAIFRTTFHIIQALTLQRTPFLFTKSHDRHDAITDGKFHKHVTCYGVITQPNFINIGERCNIIGAGESQSNCEMIVWPRRPASAHKCVRTVGLTHSAPCILNIAYRMVNKVLRIQEVSERRPSILTKVFVALLVHQGQSDYTKFDHESFLPHPFVIPYSLNILQFDATGLQAERCRKAGCPCARHAGIYMAG